MSSQLKSPLKDPALSTGSPSPRSLPPRYPKAVVVLLSAILVAVVTLIIVIATRSGGGSGSLDKSPAPADTQRIRQTYVPGKTYQIVVTLAVNGTGSVKDWGIANDMSLIYRAEMEIERQIESNDGNQIVLIQTFVRSRNLQIATQIENIRLELGDGGGLMIDLIDLAGSGEAGLPPGWTKIGIQALERLSNTPSARTFLSRVASDQNAKAWGCVSSLEGKRMRMTYVNGRGVTKVEPLGCVLSADDEAFIRATAITADAYVLPDVNAPIGSRWTLRAQDVLPAVDPSMHAVAWGDLTVSRAADQMPGGPAVIKIDNGVLELRGNNASNAYLGRWAPKGEWYYSFTDGIVTNAHLSGEVSVETRSTDHWIFEAQYRVTPQYEITYACKVMP